LRAVWPVDENHLADKTTYGIVGPVGEAEGALLPESFISLDRKTIDFDHSRQFYLCSNLANLDLSAMSIDLYPETPQASRARSNPSPAGRDKVPVALPTCRYLTAE
jgi:hypothetical protein